VFRSEELLGRFINEYPGSDQFRKKINIATKVSTIREDLSSM
jgi:aryl-alcohol dehydrogenase-like predicted oxidoreductase